MTQVISLEICLTLNVKVDIHHHYLQESLLHLQLFAPIPLFVPLNPNQLSRLKNCQYSDFLGCLYQLKVL